MVTDVSIKVAAFYRELPFNYEGTAAQAAKTIQEQNQIAMAYPPLASLLQEARGRPVIDLGCGAGWFVNTAAQYYKAHVLGVDACEPAIERAAEVTKILGLGAKARYVCADLFELDRQPLISSQRFFIVNSLGVLHHTHDCRHALHHAARLVEPGGYLHLGLYHTYGRKPFLDLFRHDVAAYRSAQDLDQQRAIEDRAFARYRQLHAALTDEVLLRSWFRDQVLHPHESQHTLREVTDWLVEEGLTCRSTSINRFQPVDDWATLFEEEKRLYEVSYQRNVKQQRYFPGFFIVVAQRTIS